MTLEAATYPSVAASCLRGVRAVGTARSAGDTVVARTPRRDPRREETPWDSTLQGRNVLLLTSNFGTESDELRSPLATLREAGATVTVVAGGRRGHDSGA